jgi:uncharacterized protein YbjT (DUF2867 family)
MKRVLLTGATGVVGGLVIPMLLERGYAVTAVGRTVEKRARLGLRRPLARRSSCFLARSG